MFLILFTTLLSVANIYCFHTKKYLYLFIPCMLFLPDYYGIEFSANFPVLSVKRIMFIILYIYVLINRRKNISLKCLSFKTISDEYYFFILYFLFRILANIYYIPVHTQALKTILFIIFEQLFLIIAVIILAPERKELIALLKAVVWTATVFFVIGIFESLTTIRFVDQLYTVSKHILNDHYVRLGLLRATTTFGIPNSFGNMCVMVFPLILYLYEITRNRIYVLSAICDIIAIIHSGCRSDMIFLILISCTYFICFLHKKDRKKLFLINAATVIISVTVFIVILSLLYQPYKYYYSGTIKSVLNEFGFSFDLNAGAPPGVEGFGTNMASGRASRMDQLSGIKYAFSQNPIFGLGSGAQARNEIKYFMFGGWYNASTIDVGFIEVLITEGIIGGVAYLSLIIAIAITISKKKSKSLRRYCCLFAFSYFLCTLSTANMSEFMMFTLLLCLLF